MQRCCTQTAPTGWSGSQSRVWRRQLSKSGVKWSCPVRIRCRQPVLPIKVRDRKTEGSASSCHDDTWFTPPLQYRLFSSGSPEEFGASVNQCITVCKGRDYFCDFILLVYTCTCTCIYLSYWICWPLITKILKAAFLVLTSWNWKLYHRCRYTFVHKHS